MVIDGNYMFPGRGSRVKVFWGYWGLGRGAKKLNFPDSVCAKRTHPSASAGSLMWVGSRGPVLGALAGCRGRAPAGGVQWTEPPEALES